MRARARVRARVRVTVQVRVDGRALDGLVDDEGHGGGVVGVGDLGVEEDLRPEEALVGDVALPRLGGLRQAVYLVRVRVRVKG